MVATRWARACALTTLLCMFATLAGGATAVAADTSQRTPAEIQARWQQLKPQYLGTPYLILPTLTAPYAAGQLTSGFLQDGLNSINYFRFLAGMPDDVVLSATNTDRAQHGAVLISVAQWAHSQPKPADMSQAFYDIANAANSSSNLTWGFTDHGLWDAAKLCMDEPGNLDAVGHRRWQLNPALQQIGFGYGPKNGRYDFDPATIYVFDWSRVDPVDYDTVAWPCAGPFPVEMFGKDVAWSVTLNPGRYSWTSSLADTPLP